MRRVGVRVSCVRNVSDIVRVSSVRSVRNPLRRCDGVCVGSSDSVRPTCAVELVPTRVVTVMASIVAARETEERHRGHTSGAEYHAENVEVHLSAHRCQRTLFSEAPIQESPDEFLTLILYYVFLRRN
jgi:hypothetical protein